MQGIRINGTYAKSKKAVKEAVALSVAYRDNPAGAVVAPRVRLVATSFFGNEYDGNVLDAPDGTYTFVGPDESRDRRFYGTITKKNGVVKVA